MIDMSRRISVILFLAALVAGCAPSQKTTTTRAPLPKPVPSVRTPSVPPSAPEAPIQISVAYPVPGQWRPKVDSNFIFGTVNNGNASLTINGYPVPVWQNGAFLAFLPMPMDGVYHLFARRGSDTQQSSVEYRIRPVAEPSEYKGGIVHKEFKPALLTEIVKGSDTLQTGNDVAPGALTPDGNREWFFPRGARLDVVEQEGQYYKVKLDEKTYAWVDDTNFDITPSEKTQIRNEGEIVPNPQYVDLIFPTHYNAFQISASGMGIRIQLYGKLWPSQFPPAANLDPFLEGVGYDSTSEGVYFTVQLTKPVWGYKAFYTSDGELDVRIRRPPKIDLDNPLKGIRIMIDPGHPPGGAIGPTGLTEREANLAVALRIRDQLAAKGAMVLMTHSTLDGVVSDYNQVEELDARSTLAVQDNVDLMLSTHENAFPDGTNPFLNYGTAAYYFQPFSAGLAAELDHSVSEVTGIPNLGSFQKSLAICRPTWMPCVLTESLYMMFPDQEAKLRDPKFLDTLAAAHVRGIEDFLRQHAE